MKKVYRTSLQRSACDLVLAAIATLLIMGCSEDNGLPRGLLEPPGGPSFGRPIYPIHQEQPSWSVHDVIAYRDNGIICVFPSGGYATDTSLAGIWTLDSRSGERRRILPFGYAPAWSHDGKRIAFELAGQIFTVDASGENLRQLTSQNSNFFPTWHPNDSTLLFDSNRGSPSGIYRVWQVDSEGMNQREFCAGREADWRPDGSNAILTWASGEFGPFPEIYAVRPPLCDATPLTRRQEFINRPRYSPDGRQIAYSSRAVNDPLPQIWIMDSDGTGQRQITLDGGSDPEWSPDGSEIVYVRPSGTEYSPKRGVLWSVDVGTKVAVQLTTWWPLTCSK